MLRHSYSYTIEWGRDGGRMSAMATQQQSGRPKEELFIDGYLTQRIKKGVLPKYGYPKTISAT